MTTIYISLGTNIEPEKYLRKGIAALRRSLGGLTLSSVFESEAVGFDGQNFLNMVVRAQTERSIDEVLRLFKQIEADNGRQAGAKKFSSRTLDIDLLLYGEHVGSHPVELPRAEILSSAFVLWPLAEIAGTHTHPLAGQTYAALWAAYDKSQQKLWPIEFTY